MVCAYFEQNGRISLTAVLKEQFQIELTAINPLNSSLVITDLTAQTSLPSDIETIPEIILEPNETRQILLSITVPSASTISLTSVSYLFHRFLPVTQPLTKRGKRLHSTKAQRLNPSYGVDDSLVVVVEERRPAIIASFRWEGLGHEGEMWEGQEIDGVLEIENTGLVGVGNVELAINEFGMIRLKGQSLLHYSLYKGDEC